MVTELVPPSPSRARGSRATSRAGVRACAGFFEDRHCAFQEVDQQNDFGKDAYVDLLQNEGSLGHCVALQIKSGPSYRKARGYIVPIGHHAVAWRESTVPVFGVVFDPECNRLGWVDLTGYLRAHPQVQSGNVVVPAGNLLDEANFPTFCQTVASYRALPSDALCLEMLSDSPPRQAQAVLDAWALGRRDVRYLLLCRRLVLEFSGQLIPFLIARMSMAAGHPDVFYTPKTWLPMPIQMRVRASLRWSPGEVAHMARAIHHEDWGRGSLGQCLDLLLMDDPDTLANAADALGMLLVTGDLEQAMRLLILALSYADDPQSYLRVQCERYPTLAQHWITPELAAQLREFNRIELY